MIRSGFCYSTNTKLIISKMKITKEHSMLCVVLTSPIKRYTAYPLAYLLGKCWHMIGPCDLG